MQLPKDLWPGQGIPDFTSSIQVSTILVVPWNPLDRILILLDRLCQWAYVSTESRMRTVAEVRWRANMNVSAEGPGSGYDTNSHLTLSRLL